MKKRLLCALRALSLLTLPGCKRDPEPVEVTAFAMDTVIQLTAYDGNTGGTRAVLGELTARLTELDSQLSATREDSFVYAVNHAGGERRTALSLPCCTTPCPCARPPAGRWILPPIRR